MIALRHNGIGYVGAAVAVSAVLAACGSDPVPSALDATTSPTTAVSSTTTSITTAPTTTATDATTSAKSTTTKRAATRSRTRTATPTTSRPSTSSTAASPAAASCAVPSGVRAAQVVLVVSSGARATVRACRRSGSRYITALGPYAGHVGANGVSSAKREGDLRTPAGVFPLRGGFGARSDPGLRIGSWLRVDSRDVWVDDSASDLYNTHQRSPANGRWSSAEKLLTTPAYDYAQVIGYNEARTPGRGSAIFLHVDLGHGTAGCVSLPTGALLAVLRWERAGAVMAIR